MGRSGPWVLDALRFVQHHAVPAHLKEWTTAMCQLPLALVASICHRFSAQTRLCRSLSIFLTAAQTHVLLDWLGTGSVSSAMTEILMYVSCESLTDNKTSVRLAQEVSKAPCLALQYVDCHCSPAELRAARCKSSGRGGASSAMVLYVVSTTPQRARLAARESLPFPWYMWTAPNPAYETSTQINYLPGSVFLAACTRSLQHVPQFRTC